MEKKRPLKSGDWILRKLESEDGCWYPDTEFLCLVLEIHYSLLYLAVPRYKGIAKNSWSYSRFDSIAAVVKQQYDLYIADLHATSYRIVSNVSY